MYPDGAGDEEGRRPAMVGITGFIRQTGHGGDTETRGIGDEPAEGGEPPAAFDEEWSAVTIFHLCSAACAVRTPATAVPRAREPAPTFLMKSRRCITHPHFLLSGSKVTIVLPNIAPAKILEASNAGTRPTMSKSALYEEPTGSSRA